MNPTDQIVKFHAGAVRLSDWVYKEPKTVGGVTQLVYRRRPIPKDCARYHPSEIETIPEPARTKARAILAEHPKTRGIIAWLNPHPFERGPIEPKKPFTLSND